MIPLPTIIIVRHGETDWSRDQRHTGRTDVPLNDSGRRAALNLRERLSGLSFTQVWTSPASRARETARLAKFPDAEPHPDLSEWDYGDYEGLTTAAIQALRPGWNLFRDGCPGGEDAAAVGARADRIIASIRARAGPLLIFSSAHFLRVLGARWAGFPPEAGAALALDTASISELGSEHEGVDPVIRGWNRRQGH